MFVGHFAVGFLAKRRAPALSLAFLVLCTAFADILWPVFILTGVERAAIVPGITAASPFDMQHYPWSHSLVMSLVWGLLLGLPWLARRRVREGLIVAGCVFSHFVLDAIVHRPDLPLWPGGSVKIGLGLWYSRAGTVVVEGALWAAALALYARETRATSGWGRYGLWAFVVVTTGAWLAGMFTPPPPSLQAVALSALPFVALTGVWLWTVERRRISI